MSLLESLTARLVPNCNSPRFLESQFLATSGPRMTEGVRNDTDTIISGHPLMGFGRFNPERCCENPTSLHMIEFRAAARFQCDNLLISRCLLKPAQNWQGAIISVLYLLPFLVHAAMKKFVLRLAAISVRDYDVLLAPFWPLFGEFNASDGGRPVICDRRGREAETPSESEDQRQSRTSRHWGQLREIVDEKTL